MTFKQEIISYIVDIFYIYPDIVKKVVNTRATTSAHLRKRLNQFNKHDLFTFRLAIKSELHRRMDNKQD